MPPAEYADLHRLWLHSPRCPPSICTATTTVVWHRITSRGSSGSSRRAVTHSSSRVPGTSCNSSSRKWWHSTSSTSSGEPDGAGMTVHRLAAVDAQTYWMSAKIPNDQFLLYGFAGTPANLDQAIDVIRGRADECADLRLRVRDGNVLTYPAWVSGVVNADQFVVHDLADRTWAGCLDAVAGLGENQLDAHVMTWRLHVFTSVEGIPGAGTGTVAVLQATHALADGVRCSALAARLFGRRDGADGEGAATSSWLHATVAQYPGRTGPPPISPRHRGRSDTPASGFTTRAAQQHPAGRSANRPHTGSTPRTAGRPHRDCRCAGRGRHGPGRAPA